MPMSMSFGVEIAKTIGIAFMPYWGCFQRMALCSSNLITRRPRLRSIQKRLETSWSMGRSRYSTLLVYVEEVYPIVRTRSEREPTDQESLVRFRRGLPIIENPRLSLIGRQSLMPTLALIRLVSHLSL